MPKRIAVRAVSGSYTEEYPTLTACAKDLDLQISHISEVCAGIRPYHKGFKFEVLSGGHKNEETKQI